MVGSPHQHHPVLLTHRDPEKCPVRKPVSDCVPAVTMMQILSRLAMLPTQHDIYEEVMSGEGIARIMRYVPAHFYLPRAAREVDTSRLMV